MADLTYWVEHSVFLHRRRLRTSSSKLPLLFLDDVDTTTSLFIMMMNVVVDVVVFVDVAHLPAPHVAGTESTGLGTD